MNIHVTFENIAEMTDFCRMMAGFSKDQGVEPVSTTVAAPASVQNSVAGPSPSTAPVQTEQPVPTANVSYSLDELARAAMTLMDSGRQVDLQQLLAQFGVEALPALPKEQYGAFATALRGMGAEI